MKCQFRMTAQSPVSILGCTSCRLHLPADLEGINLSSLPKIRPLSCHPVLAEKGAGLSGAMGCFQEGQKAHIYTFSQRKSSPKWPLCSLSPQLCIHDNYRNNPFHNFRHCFCVTQMMYSMISLCSLQVCVFLCKLSLIQLKITFFFFLFSIAIHLSFCLFLPGRVRRKTCLNGSSSYSEAVEILYWFFSVLSWI